MRLDLGVVAVNFVTGQSRIEQEVAEYFCYVPCFDRAICNYVVEVKSIESISIDDLVSQYERIGVVTQKDGYPYELYSCTEGRLLISSYPGCQHVIVKSENAITCFINEADDESMMVPIRVIREITLQEHENHGAVLVHSAAVDFQGKAILVVGDSGAGKSTLAFYSCKQGAGYLANDKCIVDQDLNVYSFPMAIRLSIPTVEKVLGSLKEVVPRFDTPTDIFFNKQYRAWGSRHKLILTVREYCRLAGARHVAKSTIKTLVLPEITPGSGIFRRHGIGRWGEEVLLRNISVSYERVDEDDWLGLVRVSKVQKLQNKSSVIGKLLSGIGMAINFSTDELESVYDTIKSS